MNTKFLALIEQLEPSFQALLNMSPLSQGLLPKDMPLSGVYLFSEGSTHLYVGRSNKLRQRYGQHCNPGSQHNQAVFAFKLAREKTGNQKIAYVPGKGTRTELAIDGVFSPAFVEAKQRVRSMDYRFVAEPHQRKQTLLELYCAIALDCPYNDFKTS